jgi:hypothetical protein
MVMPFVELPAVFGAFGPPLVQQFLERAAPALAVTLRQPGDGHAGGVFVVARTQGMDVHE